jgi:predicted Zn-dependent protease
MSAALVIVDGQPREPWAGRPIDLRVDRSDDPIGDLGRLLDAAHAFAGYHRAVEALFAGDALTALTDIDQALSELPGDENMRFLRSGALAASGDLDQAGEELKALIALRPSWETLVRSFAAKGLLTLPPSTTIDTILA